jgi:hypothetical protein
LQTILPGISLETANAAADGRLRSAAVDTDGVVHHGTIDQGHSAVVKIAMQAGATFASAFPQGWLDDAGTFNTTLQVGEALTRDWPDEDSEDWKGGSQ